ncbi:MAG: hypothetical protein GXP63_03410 [DPANN group archaeon]|nr:hypothetical protein [DPANN group archaeon]
MRLAGVAQERKEKKRLMGKGNRSQIVIEYMLLVAMGFALLLIFTAAFQGRYQDIARKQEQNQLDSVSLALEKEMLLAAKVESGYERYFTIPDLLGSKAVSVDNTDKEVIIRAGERERSFITPQIRGTLHVGTNRIRNIDGTVCIGDDCGDLAPPNILNSLPNGSVSGPDITLSVETDEAASCRYSQTDTLFANMESPFGGTGTNHSDVLSLPDGNHTYYARCRDPAGNSMDTSEVISFDVI